MCCGPLARARTLLYVAYCLLALDALIYIGFVGGGIYIATRCPEELDFHVELGFSHFFVTAAVAAVVSDWWAKIQEESSHELPASLPLYWVVGALVTLSTDSFLLVANVLNPEPSTECSFRLLHKTLEATGVASASLSLLWFLCVTAATWRLQRKLARARRAVLGEPVGYSTANAPIRL
jgi:arginine exporter protein ArgO